MQEKMPGYQKLIDEYGSRGLMAIGFKFDNMPDIQHPIHFAKEIGVHYPLAVASEDLKPTFGGIESADDNALRSPRTSSDEGDWIRIYEHYGSDPETAAPRLH